MINTVLQWLGLLSVVTFVVSLLVVPWGILRLPADVFCWKQPAEKKKPVRSLSTLVLWLLRNGVGAVLLVAGIFMLVLPGQGLLTIVLGLFLMDFPGKFYLLDVILHNKAVQHSLNWIRRKGNRPEFTFFS